MSRFPDTIQFNALNRPIRAEVSLRNLEVEGQIPPEIQGAFFRAVPDPEQIPLFENDIALSGDGMVSRFLFEGGQVDHDIRYVHTARYLAEHKARRALFGRYRNPYTDLPEARGVDRTLANTTPVWHAGRLFMTKEDGRAYEVNPHTLTTLGSWDYGGALRSETMTAHVRVDPKSGEMFFYGYEAGGLCTTDIAYCIADRDGKLVSEQWFNAPYCAMVHDFAITERWAIFPIYPTTADLERLKAGGPHWNHEQQLESWVGIMPRYGKVGEMRWFKGPAGVSAYHLVNAYDEGDLVHLDSCLSDTNAFPFIREDSGIFRDQRSIQGGLTRWTFDMSRPGDSFASRPLGPPGDLPRLRDADQGRPYDRCWYLSVNPQGGPPLSGGPVGTAFTCLLRLEPATGRIDMMGLPPSMAINEPVHVPGTKPGHDGWLLLTVDREIDAGRHESELWVVDATDVAAGPIAKVKLPVPLRPQVHGWWVPAPELARARAARA
ncbi:MAG TPA: carotenoid oxygenase family protein [Steroidobacteraceae bacterium]|jgi:carotenoid cleavage dioxygenase|nr:carotenoid oxygenase family protein [Steroidobacteraceae bacterium]